jgi:chromosome segregation ATPase
MHERFTDVDPVATGDVERLSVEVLRLRDLVHGYEAEIGELDTRLSRLDEQRKHSERLWQERLEHTERDLARAVDRAAAIEASTSWRLGQFLLKPVDVWRRTIRR